VIAVKASESGCPLGLDSVIQVPIFTTGICVFLTMLCSVCGKGQKGRELVLASFLS
jgi:hypothetical protein